MSKTSEASEPAIDEVLIVPESREGGRFHRPRFASLCWSVCNRYEPSHEDLVERVPVTQAREDGFQACANCWPELRADRVEESEDDGVDRGEGIIADGGSDLLPTMEELARRMGTRERTPIRERHPTAIYLKYSHIPEDEVGPRDVEECSFRGISPDSDDLPAPPKRRRREDVDPFNRFYRMYDPAVWELLESGASDEEVREAVATVDGEDPETSSDDVDEPLAAADGGYVGSTDEEVREAVEDVEDDEVDRGDGIVTDGGVDVDSTIPRGWRPNHQSPAKWRVRCPSCEAVEVVDEVPKRETRRCRSCDRLQGVTPISLVPYEAREPLGPEPAPEEEPESEPDPVEVDWNDLTPAFCPVPSSGIEAEWDDGEASEEFLASVTDGGVDRGDGPITDGGVDVDELVLDVVDDNLASLREDVLQGREPEALGTLDLLREDVSMPETRLREYIRTGREPEALGTIDRLRVDLWAGEWVPHVSAREVATRSRAARRAVADGGETDE